MSIAARLPLHVAGMRVRQAANLDAISAYQDLVLGRQGAVVHHPLPVQQGPRERPQIVDRHAMVVRIQPGVMPGHPPAPQRHVAVLATADQHGRRQAVHHLAAIVLGHDQFKHHGVSSRKGSWRTGVNS